MTRRSIREYVSILKRPQDSHRAMDGDFEMASILLRTSKKKRGNCVHHTHAVPHCPESVEGYAFRENIALF